MVSEGIHDEQLEQALIGWALVADYSDPRVNVVFDAVRAADFCLHAHATIWQAICSLRADGAEVDAVTLAAELRSLGRFDTVGGSAYLDQCLAAMSLVAHPVDYARRVAGMARRRAVGDRADRAKAVANDPGSSDQEVEQSVAAMRSAWDSCGEELPSLTEEELYALDFPARSEWLIRDWWLTEACGFIGAWEKSSKTVLAIALAFCVAYGQQWLGQWEVTRGPVVLVLEEDHKRRVQRRFHRIKRALGITGASAGIHVCAQEGCNLATQRGRGRLAALVRRVKPVLVVIDPLRRVTPGVDEKDSQQMSEVLAWLRALQAECKTSVMVLHHLRKEAAGDAPDRSRMSHRLRGSGDLPAWFDSFITISRRTESEHVIEAEHRDAKRLEKQKVIIAWDDDHDELRMQYGGPVEKAMAPRFGTAAEARQEGALF